MNESDTTIDTVRLQRLEDAAAWLLRMQSPERSDEELNEWLRWIDADPRNFAEFERLQSDWKDLDALKCWPSTQSDAQRYELIDEPSSPGARHGQQAPVPRRVTPRSRTQWAVAASLSLIAAGLGSYGYLQNDVSRVSGQLTAATLSQSTTLPDGSKMILGAQSRVDMDFNHSVRQLALSNGEAYFKVKHDRVHPFVVQAGDVTVTAVGTAFDVHRKEDHVIVTIEDGTVDVRGTDAAGKPATWRVQEGYQVNYSSLTRTASVSRINTAVELGWRDGELSYVREPLGSVVEDLNRYSSQKILIKDPKVAQLRFTGTAFASAVKDWVAGIQQAYPVDVHEDSSGVLIVDSKH